VTESGQVKEGDGLDVRLHKGRLHCMVKSIHEEEKMDGDE
jgi:ribosomal 50S subunit-recycling heat shock protein